MLMYNVHVQENHSVVTTYYLFKKRELVPLSF